MIVNYNEFFYEITLDSMEMDIRFQAYPCMKNYMYQNGKFIPKILKKLPLEIMESEILPGGLSSKISATYPYYITQSDYFIGWNGNIEILKTKISNHKAIRTDNQHFIIEKSTYIVPGDKITYQTDNFIVENPFTFIYDLGSKRTTLILSNIKK